MPSETFPDPAALWVSVPVARPGTVPHRPPRPRHGERFLKGPVPWSWLTRATRLPGAALAVGLAVWFRAGLTRSSTVRLSLSALEADLGVKRDAARRGLAALEAAGLVRVDRGPGRRPVVTVLAAGPGTVGGDS